MTQTLNGLRVERRLLADLTPAPWNPRRMDEQQAKALQRSLAEFGTVEPILVNDVTGHVVGGHQRLAALLANGETATDVLVGSWPEEREKALNIALNKIHGEWDEDKLGALLAELQGAEFDFGLTGFSGDELEELFSTGDEDEVRQLTPEQEEQLNAAWCNWAADALNYSQVMREDGIASPSMTRACARIYFLRSLFLGERYPRWCSHAFHPHQIEISGHVHSLLWALERAKTDPAMAARFRWAMKETPVFDTLLKQMAPIHSSRLAADFPADLARDLINEFCPAGGAVLDPCHGWGGRLVGFLLSHAVLYNGYDPAVRTNAGVKTIMEDYSPHTPGKESRLFCERFESAILRRNFYDFALTSPPYFNVEKYEGENSSHVKFPNFELWDNGFYRELIGKVHGALKPGSVFALQVGNQSFPLEARAKIHAAEFGFEYMATRATSMRNTIQETAEEDGEVIVLFKKRHA